VLGGSALLSKYTVDLPEKHLEMAWHVLVEYYFLYGLPVMAGMVYPDEQLYPNTVDYRDFMLELTLEVTRRTFFEDAESLTECLVERDNDNAINCVRIDEVTIKVGG
jgi:hypothetical protein